MRRPATRELLIETLEQRLVLSAAPVANLFARFQDQVVTEGDVRSVGFSIGDNAFGGGSSFVRIDVAPQSATTRRLAGDYDGNTVVDGADFLVWQRQFGTQGISAADGNLDGAVDAADYVVWRNNFGRVGAAAASFAPTAVKLRDGGGVHLPAVQAGMATQAEAGSFAVFEIRAGEYLADVEGIGIGAFELRMTLIGDLDGDRDVDAADLETIRNLSRTGGYDASADVNLDGAITSFDYSYARRNNERTLALTPMPQVSLEESNSFASRYSEFIDLSPVDGSRALTIDVDAAFDLSAVSAQGDLFQVYLLDASTGEPLLAGVGEGSALFSLSESGQELSLGRVTYSGGRITVDLSGITGADNVGELVLQLLSGDADEGSLVKILDIQNETSEESASLQLLSATPLTKAAGPSLDLGSLTQSNDIEALISNVRFDPAQGVYRAHLRVKNLGASTGRIVAVVFPDLPNGVSGLNPSGVTATGAPYWNLRSAITSGGLQAGTISEAIEVAFSNPAVLRLILSPQVLIGGPNRAPAFGPLAGITLHPGEVIETTFAASDLDADEVRFSIRSATSLPSNEFSPAGRLTFRPGLNDLGTYVIEVTATDGVASTTQTLALTIAPDPVATTRISGIVLDTNGRPLENVPVEIAGYSARTAADGSFTIALPTMKTPTEAFNILVPSGDVHLDPFNTGSQEIPLRRARFDVTSGTSVANPRQHPNLVSSFIDASVVYGSDEDRATALRTYTDGKLKVSAGNLLPLNNLAAFPSGTLENDNEGRVDPALLFAAGDVRANENVALIALHTILVREHNRLADAIKASDPLLTDEAIYQQARRLVGAILQHITYSEYLPLLLGSDAIGPYEGYDPLVDPSESEAFASAAFRLGHTQISSEVKRLDASGGSLPGGSLALRNAFFTVAPIKTDGIEPYLRGLAATPMQEVDVQIIDDVRNFLFGPPGAGGMDLASLNIQRGRDVGLSSYVQARLDFGLPVVTSFAQITSNPSVQAALASVYGTVDKVDLWVGGLAEDHAPGAVIGPLLQAILKDQFERTRDGDRFWYENGQFTEAELTQIRGTTLESLIERNAPGVDLPETPFTTGVQPVAPAPAGTAASGSPSEIRTLAGTNNNVANPTLGSTGTNVLRNFTNGYGDGISTPGGADRPAAREISNAVNAQTGSVVNATGLTSLLTFWGQLLDHDLGLTPGGVSDTLRIQGNLRPVGDDGAAYPFVAEKMELMLGHAVYPDVNNVIARPIYLPAIDVANAVTINPAQDTLVTTGAIEGASVLVKAGTLQDRQGHLFTGQLSITEVPLDFTPAALPSNLLPDLVVTIQPADMVLSTPAPLSLPNRAGWAPGTMMDLWSINPITGFFEVVGEGKVSADGSVVETTSGGIRNSSWHFFALISADDLLDESKDNLCGGEATVPASSEIGLLSGALIESHTLIPYHSLGTVRGLTLVYDSKRAEPRTELNFSIKITATGNANQATPTQVLGRASIQFGDAVLQATSANADNSLLWDIGRLLSEDVGSRLAGGIAFNMNDVPTGIHSYKIQVGTVLSGASGPSGTLTERTGTVVIVNGRSAAFGAGWGLAGLTEIFEAVDGSLLLVDGDGSELVYKAPMTPGGAYVNPMGYFGSLVKLPTGTFRFTDTDQAVYDYNAANKLSLIVDRNGNETRFEYSGGRLSQIVDSAGLATTFTFAGDFVSSITDPAGRITRLSHDVAGNLTSITDPDSASRHWQYDASHRMTGETTERGFQETILYDSRGMVSEVVRSDGTTVSIVPANARGLATSETSALVKRAVGEPAKIATRTDGNGSATAYVLDTAGQFVSASDGAGSLGTVTRNDNNLISSWLDGRGNRTSVAYDASGNPMQSQEELFGSQTEVSLSGNDQVFRGGSPGGAIQTVAGDINGDGLRDLVFVSRRSLTTPFVVFAALGSGNGLMRAAQQVVGPLSGAVPSIELADLNHDGLNDLIVAESDKVSFLLATGTGSFSPVHTETSTITPRIVKAADVDNDGIVDIVVVGRGVTSGLMRVFFGDGNGGVRSAIGLQGASQSFASIAAADFNNDGYVDLAAPDIITSLGDDFGTGTISLFINNGAAGFLPRVAIAAIDADIAYLDAADLNSDRHVDLVGMSDQSGIVRMYFGDGLGGFSNSQQLKPTGVPRQTELSDFNSDGLVDILTAGGGIAEIYFGKADGGLADPASVLLPPGRGFAWNEIADIDNDNHVDIVDSFNTIQFGDGTGQFLSVPSYRTTNSTFSADRSAIMTADVNNDGTFDLVETNDSGDITVLLGDGIGRYSSAPIHSESQSRLGSFLHIADINNDGYDDVVSGYTYFQQSGSIVWLLGDGSGRFTFDSTHRVSPGSDLFGTLLVDADGDDNLDLVISRHSSADVTYMRGNGQGDFAAERLLFMQGTGPGSSIASGDFNDDGVVDILCVKFDGSRSVATIYTGDGAGMYSLWQSVDLGVNVGKAEAKDVNGDRLLDFYIQEDRTVSVYLQRPGQVFENSANLPAQLSISEVASLDANRDGIPDFALTMYRNVNGEISPGNQLLVYAGNADGTYQNPVSYSTDFGDSGFQSLAVADLDGDDDDDVVVSNPAAETVNIYLNYARSRSVEVLSSATNYDPVFSRPTSRTDERGNVTNFTIDAANGNTTEVSGPEGQRMGYTYTAAGLIDTMTDSLGRVTDYDYNALGRLTTVTYAKGTVDQGIVRYEYDLAGNMTAMIDELTHRTEYEYDGRNRLTLVRDSLNNATKYEYDKAGNVTKITDALNHVTINQYDTRNRLIRTTDFQNNVTQFAYDSEGNLVRVIDPLGNVTKHRYDARDRRIETVDPDGGKTLFRYDADDNLIALTDPEGNRTLFFYDARNRLIKETDPLGKSITYKYDAADNLVEKKDRDSRVTRYAYDGLNRLKTETWVGDGNVFTYSYDTESDLLDVADDFSHLSYTYDARYRVTSVDNHGSQAGGTPQAPRVVVNYAYDAASNVLSVIDTINGAAGATTSYLYDALNLLTKLTQTGTGLSDKRVDFGYNVLSQTTSIDRYRNLAGTQTVAETTFAFDTLNRIESITHQNGSGSSLAFYDYVYDDASRITRITDVDGITNYGHDDRDQLTSASHSDPGQADESYAYDANGNRESSHLHGSGYVVGPGNRLLSDGTYNYEYDNEGNTVKRTEIATGNYREFTWDYRNRLVKVVDKLAGGTPTQIVEFNYDAFDRRISKSVDAAPLDAVDAAFTSFVYDREDVILDFVDADGAGAAPMQLDQRYLHGPGIDQVLAQDNGAGTTHWMLTDHLGSVRDLVTNAGAIADHVVYDSFGNAGGATLSRYQFTGREFDGETNLAFYRSRSYDTHIGRFLSEDTVGFYAADPNLFRYTFNSPIEWTDPSGRFVPLVALAYGAAGGAVFGGTVGGVLGGYFAGIEGALRGLVTGMFGGAIGGLAGVAGAGLAGGGLLGGILGGAAGGAAGDAASQGLGIQLGWRCTFDWSEFEFSAALGALTGGAGFRPVNPRGTLVPATHYGPPSPWYQLGPKGPLNYLATGVQHPYGSGVTSNIPSSNLGYPRGIEGWKGLLGQRILE